MNLPSNAISVSGDRRLFPTAGCLWAKLATPLALGVVLSTMMCVRSTADLVMPISDDAVIDAQLRLLSEAEDGLHSHRDASTQAQLDALIAVTPDPEVLGWAKFQLAVALTGLAQPNSAITIFNALADTWRSEEPLLAAWSVSRAGDALKLIGSDVQAMLSYRQTEQFLGVLSDVGPLLYARRKAAEHFFRTTEFDPAYSDTEQILGVRLSDPADKAWALATLAGGYAWMGNVEEAYKDLESLRKFLPGADRRYAIAAIDVAIGEIQAYDWGRRTNMEQLVHAQDLIRAVEADFPAEEWLVSRGKLEILQFEVEHRVGLDDAVKYAQEIIPVQDRFLLRGEAEPVRRRCG